MRGPGADGGVRGLPVVPGVLAPGQRRAGLVGEGDSDQPLLQCRPRPRTRDKQEPSLQQATRLGQQLDLAAGRRAFPLRTRPGRRTRPRRCASAGLAADPRDTILEPARRQRQQPGELPAHLLDQPAPAGYA
jgi:hypothetical protein